MSDPVELSPATLRPMPVPGADAKDKESRGRVMVVGGGTEVPGAVLLAGTSALRAGSGKLQIATVRSAAVHLAIAMPEARVLALPETPGGEIAGSAGQVLSGSVGRCDTVLIGPGMLDEAEASHVAATLLREARGPSFVLDAAAMAAVRDARALLDQHDGRVIITPHAGEMASLLGMDKAAVEADPRGTARHAAEMFGVLVVLKGATTWIAVPGGATFVNRHGCVGLGTSGSGDTLAGLIAGLAARGADPCHAAAWGVYVHAEAGVHLAHSMGQLGFLAREIPALFPGILTTLTRGAH